jgi:hypothetical protein
MTELGTDNFDFGLPRFGLGHFGSVPRYRFFFLFTNAYLQVMTAR